jgi:hypothetical protein
MVLFYEAFYIRNYENLSSLLMTMLTVNVMINKLTEVCAPYIKKRIKKKMFNKKQQKQSSSDGKKSKVFIHFSLSKLSNLIYKFVKDDENLIEYEKQAYTLEQYEGTYSDYVTLFEQYGYIALFSSVFPWISLAALANNVMEMRSDAFVYCHVNKRPFPQLQQGIGPWLNAFEIIGLVSAATNIGLMALHPDVRLYFNDYSDLEYFFLFVFAEVS